MGGTAAALCEWSLNVFGGCRSREWEAAIPTHPACVDLELISLTQDAWVSAGAGL